MIFFVSTNTKKLFAFSISIFQHSSYLILFHQDYTDGTTSCVILAFLSNTAALVAMSLSVLRGTFQGKVKFLRMIVVGTLALSSKNHVALFKLYYHSYLYMVALKHQSVKVGHQKCTKRMLTITTKRITVMPRVGVDITQLSFP